MLQEISKISLEMKKKNEVAFDQFRYALLSANIAQLNQLLDPRGRFFGKLSKACAIAKISKYFYEETRVNRCLWPELREGFSLDAFPGEHAIEFRLLDVNPFEEEGLSDYTFGDPPRKEFKEIVFCLSLRFKDGKITSIRFPKKVIASISNLQLCN
ncbi:MAG: hypothetical protein EBS09_07505 [Flavobacteriia bacterium]|nr:hypothetical protein [Flavobacteriia bacterium]NBV67122.1 hypothetical protein [Flavobacteriia bacterium]NBY40317.1 hypothetical protein [Flavobacteriia bacterium]